MLRVSDHPTGSLPLCLLSEKKTTSESRRAWKRPNPVSAANEDARKKPMIKAKHPHLFSVNPKRQYSRASRGVCRFRLPAPVQ